MPTTEEKYEFLLLSIASHMNGLQLTPAMVEQNRMLMALDEGADLVTTQMIDYVQIASMRLL